MSETTATNHIVTVFAPGLGGSLGQVTKYVGSEGLQIQNAVGQVHHLKYSKPGPKLLHNVWTGCGALGADVLPYDVWQLSPLWFVVLLCFAWTVGYWYTELLLVFCCTLVVFSINFYKGTGVVPYMPVPWRVNVAQRRDVAHYVSIVCQAADANPGKGLVLFGTSRGGAVVVQALLNLPDRVKKQVRLVISECPFDSVESVLSTRHFPFPWLNGVIAFLLPFLTAYDPKQPSPVELVRRHLTDDNIPVAFITSEVDTVVRPQHTRALVAAVRDRIKPSLVHFLTLKHSSHSGYAVENKDDQECYQIFINSLYHQYLLPEPESKAEQAAAK